MNLSERNALLTEHLPRIRRSVLGRLRVALAHVPVDELESVFDLAAVVAAGEYDPERSPCEFPVWMIGRTLWRAIDLERLRGVREHEKLNLLRPESLSERAIVDEEAADEMEAMLGDPGPDPLAQVLAGQRAARVRAAIDALPERERYLVIEHFYRGRMQYELACELGVTPGRVSQLLAQAARRLRSALADYRAPRRLLLAA
jgi:RNA polymerase sigma factor (sigma-70 family)